MDYNPIELEKEIMEFWKKNKIYQKSKNKGKKQFYFLDGPPYTSGKVHIGTAWNKILKDSFLRYKRMNKIDVWDRAGYDMHGLPTEHAVLRKLGIKDKDQVEKYGVKKFIEECKKFSIENMNLMTEDFKRLGIWMDFENAYQTIKDEYIDAEWWLIKKAHENKRLYESKKTMPWCPHCETALAKHELEYETIKENSIFLKFKILGTKNEYLIIWTTTPWTIPFNLAVMANPELSYLKVKVDEEIWIIAKALASSFITTILNKKFKILEEFKGKDIEGLKYEHPFKDIISYYSELEKTNKKVHTVVLSEEYVNTSSGSGLVHCAPGCGPEDYEVGYKYNLPPYNTLDQKGVFPKSMGKFHSFIAKRDDQKFIEELKKQESLIKETKIEHEYPFCWRCHNPIIFRTTLQWFFKIEDLKENMKELNKQIKWVPDWAGSRQFHSWLDNLRDNSITKQRYWGTPLPVWRCKTCNNYTVIGSIEELKKLTTLPKDLHKPYIDEVKIKCRCGGEQTRIPDVLDVWVDAGVASWACLNFPQKKELFTKLYPPDFILEGKDQIRGWFNLLFVASMVSMQKPAFKAVYMHGFIQDALGRKMSKSLGNYILPEEVLGKYGADTMRYYMVGASNPGVDLNYNFKDMDIKARNLRVLWNLHLYLIDYSKNIKLKKPTKLSIEEKYILSKLNSTIKKVTKLFEDYQLSETPNLIEDLFLELSRTYIQLIRDRLSIGTKEEKQIIISTIYEVLINILKLFSPIIPFTTEKIYQNLKKEFKLKEQSIHLINWPKANEKLIDEKLEGGIKLVKEITQELLAQREKAKINVRWPLKRAEIHTENPQKIKPLIKIIKKQTNIKIIILKKGKLKVQLNTQLTKELEQEGFARELTRRIQTLRKKANLKKENKINLIVITEYELGSWKKEIKEKVGAKTIKIVDKITEEYNYSSIEKIRNINFKIYFNQNI